MVYRGWDKLFDPSIEICPVELPGRGFRLGEPPLQTMSALRDVVLHDLLPLADRPIALFGHSMGAKLAFEISKELGKRVVHLFASASSAPNRSFPIQAAKLPDPEFIAHLRRLGGTPDVVLSDPGMLELLLPVIRADLEVVETYRATNSDRAPCSVTVFAGSHDAHVSVESTRQWEAFSEGPFRFVSIDAGHFYLAQAASLLACEIARDIAPVE